MYALPTSADRACYLCVPPIPGIEPAALGDGEAAALGASVSPALGTGETATPGAGDSTLSGTAPAAALYTFTLDSGASQSFFRDSTALTPLIRLVPVSVANPSCGPVCATSSTVLPCPAVPSGTLSGLDLPSFSTNLTGRHLATFTRQPGSGLYTLVTASPQIVASASASGQMSAPCSCRALSHQTLLWHHRLGHPSVQRLRSMHCRVLVSGLPRVLPPLPPSHAPPCLPCVEKRQRAAPHSSFPPTKAPLRTLHLDVWGPARIRGQGHERHFLLVVDDYTRYTTVFPLRTKSEVPNVLIPWIRAARLQLRDRFHLDFPVLRLHSDRGGEISSDLLAAFCAEHGIRQTFTLPASPQQNGVAENRIGLVMEVARTSMIHAAAPHFLWSFAVQYAAHQLNLWPRVSLPETSPTLLWTGKVDDASHFWVWGARAFVRDTTADKLSARAVPCVFLGFVPDAPGWQFYHPTSRRVFSSQDVTFDESVDPLPAPGPAPSEVSQVDPPPLTAPVEVTGDSGPAEGGSARGAASGGAEPGGVERGGAEPGGTEPRGAEPGGVEPGGAEPRGAEPGGAETGGAEPGREESGGAAPGSTESGGAAPRGTEASGEQSPYGGVSAVALLVPCRCTLVVDSLSPHSSYVSGTLAVRVALLELGALLREALVMVSLLLVLFLLEVLELLRVLAPEVLELLRVLVLEVLELLRVLALRVLSLLVRSLLGVAAFVRVCLSPHSSCTTGTVAVRVTLLELGALPLEVLLLASLEMGVVLVPEVLVLEVLELLGLEVLSLRVLLLETLGLGVLLLETLRLETLGLEVLVLGVLLLVELVLEELVLRVLELLEVLGLLGVLELQVC
ncbi:unnamed protein product [Closterium sp. NIES-65]|nr:unnamed protein product [Closterium sp. NIES-65]